MINLVNSQKDKPQLVPGSYVAQVKKLVSHPTEEELQAGKKMLYGPYLAFSFKIMEPTQFVGAWITGFCANKTHLKGKLREWLMSMGINFNDLGGKLDETVVMDKVVRIRVEEQKDKAGNVLIDDRTQLPKLTVSLVASLNAPVNLIAPGKTLAVASGPKPTISVSSTLVQTQKPVQVPVVDNSMDDVPF